jgi:flagellar hook-associated protein FlgK
MGMRRKINALIETIRNLNADVIHAKANKEVERVIDLQDLIIEKHEELAELLLNG